jgi:hypothetical protein
VANDPAWILVEVQQDIDETKGRRWLLAAALLHDDREAMGDLVVITAKRHVAEWAGRVASATGRLGSELVLRPTVLLLSGEAEALLDEARPELAFFAAWGMQDRHGPDAERIVRRALDLTALLPEALRPAQVRAIFNVLSTAMFARLKEIAMHPDSFPESPGLRAWREELEARGEARALLTVLATRGIVVDEPSRARILSTADASQLERWLERAVTASSLADVFSNA